MVGSTAPNKGGKGGEMNMAMENILVASGTWINPGSMAGSVCPQCGQKEARVTTREPSRRIVYNENGRSPEIKGTVLFISRSWTSRSGLTWCKPIVTHRWWWCHGPFYPSWGLLLKDPVFSILPAPMAFTALGNEEAVLDQFLDIPPIKARKGDGPFETRTSWAAFVGGSDISFAAFNNAAKKLCLPCLDKEVSNAASHRQGHLTLAPLAKLTEAAQAAVAWLREREPSDPGMFNHGVQGAAVRTHSGRVSLIETPTEGDAIVSSPDHPDEEIVLPQGEGPWVAVHPWPSRGRAD
jgi:hypothetical protein